MSPPLVAAATSPPTASPIAGEQQHHSINDDPMTLGRSMTLGTSIFSSSSSGGISRPYRAAGVGVGGAASSSSSSTTETPDDEAELDPEALAACKERMCGASHPSIDLEERTLTRMNGGCCCCSQAPGSSQRGRERDPDDRAHVRQRTPSLGIGTSRSIRFGSARLGSIPSRWLVRTHEGAHVDLPATAAGRSSKGGHGHSRCCRHHSST